MARYGRDIAAGLKNLVGGEITDYTELLTDSRHGAISRMMFQARLLGYNAICNVRYESADIGGNVATNNNENKNKTLKMAACTVSGTAYVQA